MRYPLLCITAIGLLAGLSDAQTQSQPPAQPKPQAASQSAPREELTPDQIIQKFASQEEAFYEAWMQYTYVQSAEIRIVSVDGVPQNERMTLVYQVVFNDDGSRELQLMRSSGQLRTVFFTPEDKQAIRDINPFALTKNELPLYNLKYEGREKADELDCYVFSVSPRSTKAGKLYFKGRIWVDDRDLQVVKTVGRPVPQTSENQFPDFETIRQMVDDKYWFPVWTHADSKLKFTDKEVRIEETITYGDYKRFGSKATILFPSQK